MTHIGPYTIVEELGRGGMGVVYRTRRGDLQRDFALKVIKGDGSDPEAVERFRREAQAAAALSGHPGIVGVHDIGEADGIVYFAMDCVEGRSLEQLIDAADLDPRDAAAYVEQAARAVQHAHQNGVLHRDLKPGNILVTERGEARVTDFGLAKHEKADSDSARLTQSGVVIGTPHYMAPEQARNAGVDARADVYSLGATLYEALVGTPPFDGDTVLEVLSKLMRDEPRSPRTRDPRVPPALDVIVMKCLEKDPEHRYPSAGALGDDLGRWLRGEAIAARKPSVVRRAKRWVATHKTLATAAVMLVAGGAASLGVWLGTRERDRETIDQLSAQAAAAKASEAEAKAAEAARIERERKIAPLLEQARRALEQAELLARVPEPDQSAIDAAMERSRRAVADALALHATSAEGLALRGRIAARSGGLEAAERDFTAALANSSSPAPLHRARARVRLARYMRLRGLPQVIFESGQLFAVYQRPDSDESRRVRADLQEDMERVGAAIPLVTGALALCDERFASALPALSAAIAAAPYDADALAYRGRARLLAANVGGAAADFVRCLRVMPGRADARLGLATCEIVCSRFDRAMALCDEAEQIAGATSETVVTRAQALLAARRAGEALRLLEAAVAERPGAAAVWAWRASAAMRIGRQVTAASAREADGWLTKALELDPLSWYSWLERARIRNALRDRAAACADMDQAIALRPREATTLLLQSRWLHAAKRYREAGVVHSRFHVFEGRHGEGETWGIDPATVPAAIAELTAAIEASPEDGELRLARAAYLYHAPGGKPAAIRDYAVAAQGGRWRAHARLLRAHAQARGNEPAAGIAALRALTTDPDVGGAAVGHHAAIINADFGSRTNPLQVRSFERAARTDPWDSTVIFNLGMRYAHLGDHPAASELFARTTYFYQRSMAHDRLGAMFSVNSITPRRWKEVVERVARAEHLHAAAVAALMVHGRVAEAERYLLQRRPNEVWGYASLLARCRVLLGRPAEVAALRAQLDAEAAANPMLRHTIAKTRACAAWAQDDRAGALRWLRQARATVANGGDARNCWAPATLRALEALGSGLTAEPGPAVAASLAALSVRSGRIDRALHFAKIHARDGTADAQLRLAALWIRSGEPAQALDLLARLDVPAPRRTEVAYLQLRARIGMGRYAEAEEHGLAQMNAGPVGTDFIGFMAETLGRNGKYFTAALAAMDWWRFSAFVKPNTLLLDWQDARRLEEAIWEPSRSAAGHSALLARAVRLAWQGDFDGALKLADQALPACEAAAGAAAATADDRERLALALVFRLECRLGGLMRRAGDAWEVAARDHVLPDAERDGALEVLKRARGLGWHTPERVARRHAFLALREDPRVAALLADMGLK
ncbi:MAG: protein kinase domain-containing protein [Planctomycetota bacterium]|jgi:tetratricopeptide (TPR) repeat protein